MYPLNALILHEIYIVLVGLTTSLIFKLNDPFIAPLCSNDIDTPPPPPPPPSLSYMIIYAFFFIYTQDVIPEPTNEAMSYYTRETINWYELTYRNAYCSIFDLLPCI